MDRRQRALRVLGLVGLALSLGLGLAVACAGSDGAEDPGAATSTIPITSSTPLATVTTTSTTVAPPTTEGAPAPGPTSSTTAPASPTTEPSPGGGGSPSTLATLPAAPGFTPGQPCAAGSDRDCVDPEGDGTYLYLLGGGDCMASPIGPGGCADLDGDGYAGYPDSG